MRKHARTQLKEPYSRILIPEENGGFSAELLEFPGCVAQGATADEALHNLEIAAKDWIKAMKDQGGSIPEPLTGHGFSGAVSLRLPRSLHRRSMQLAARDRTSLNQFLVSTIAARHGAEELLERFCEQMVQKLTEALHVSFVKVTNQATLNLYVQVGTAQSTAATLPQANPITGSQPTLQLTGANMASSGTDGLLLAPSIPAEAR